MLHVGLYHIHIFVSNYKEKILYQDVILFCSLGIKYSKENKSNSFILNFDIDVLKKSQEISNVIYSLVELLKLKRRTRNSLTMELKCMAV